MVFKSLLEKLEQANPGMIDRRLSSFGILGVVRFLHGYYIITISQRRKIAMIGGHAIYCIEDTQMASIYNTSFARSAPSPDEQKYMKMFMVGSCTCCVLLVFILVVIPRKTLS